MAGKVNDICLWDNSSKIQFRSLTPSKRLRFPAVFSKDRFDHLNFISAAWERFKSNGSQSGKT